MFPFRQAHNFVLQFLSIQFIATKNFTFWCCGGGHHPSNRKKRHHLDSTPSPRKKPTNYHFCGIFYTHFFHTLPNHTNLNASIATRDSPLFTHWGIITLLFTVKMEISQLNRISVLFAEEISSLHESKIICAC
jgi:hypothetical protein